MSTEPNTGQPEATTPPAAAPPQPWVPPATIPAQGPPRRSPGLALVLSFFPGLGHLYLGLYQRAFAVFFAFAFAIWMSERAHPLGILVAFVWFFAVIDSYRQAQILNQCMLPEPMTLPSAAAARANRRGSLGFGVFLLGIGAVLLYNQFYPIDFTFLEDWWPLLLVLAGLYLIGSNLLERQRQRRQEAEGQFSDANL